jgi:putative ABC transport system ATP-binding protein
MKNIIETQNLKKLYNEGSDIQVNALDGVNINIKQGEFTAIVGPSGSGKTTLLNIIGGLDHPTAGKVIIDGQDISRFSENQLIDFRLHNIGFVFQAYNLIPVLSAYENAEFIMLLQNRPFEERNKRVKDLLKAVGLEDQINKKPAQMSGGQQQRVAVARALASKPKFVLADEPTANLDSKSTTQLLDIMKKLNEEEGITFIFSTHDQRVIDRAKRIITLDDGKITGDLSQKQTAISRPANDLRE